MRKTNPIHAGLRSPMVGNVGKIKGVRVADGTVMKGTAPTPAPMSSPLQPENPGKRPQKLS